MKIVTSKIVIQTIFAITLFFGVMAGSFLLFNIAPGDPARIMLGPNASEKTVELVRHQLGTDLPLWEQWIIHVKRIIQFDLGRSIIDGCSVRDEVLKKFLVTAKIGAFSIIIALLISYINNLMVYLYPRINILIKFVNIGVAMPTFFTGVIAALIFSVWFPLISLAGFGGTNANWTTLLLPALIAALYPTALMTRLLHEKIKEASTSNYTRAVLSLGFSKWYIFHRSLLRTALVSWLAALVNQLSIVFVASFVLEVIFTIPGIGILLISSIQRKDYPVLQGILIINAIFFITLSWLSEVIFSWLDPRVRQNVAA